MSRRAADFYLRRWDYVLDGEVMRLDPQLRAGRVWNGMTVQDENFVRNLAAHFRLEVRRFPAVQYLGCCGASTAPDEVIAKRRHGMRTSCFSRACVRRRMVPDETAAQVCSAATTPQSAAAAAAAAAAAGAHAMQPINGKYRSEVETAVHHAIALGLPGAQYTYYPGLDDEGRPCAPSAQPRARGPACAPAVGISVPRAHQLGFRALLQQLKRRAFRGDSAHVVWTGA